jgi:flagellar protein FliO/FliZ
VAVLTLTDASDAWANAPGAAGSSELVRLLLIAFLVLICAATVWFVIRKRHQLSTGASNASKMAIVGVLPVGPREKVVLVQVRHRTLLLGVTAHEVRLLANLTDGGAEDHAASNNAQT